MIVGHGIDLQDLHGLKEALHSKPQLAAKILTPKELAVYADLPTKRGLAYLAGRWAAKEAFAKAMGTGLVKGCGFQDIEVLSTEKGAPVCTRSPFVGRVWVSISHTDQLVQASVILEKETSDDSKSSPPNLG